MKKYIYSALTAILALGFAACTPKAIEPDQWYVSEEQADKMIQEEGGTLYTLNDFVAEYMTKCGVIFPVRQRSYTYQGGYQMNESDPTKNNRGWFSIDTIPTDGPGIYIRGRIVTDDYDGNFYKSMVIQEVVNGKQQALRVSVDASSLGGQYQIGQVIQIRVNGLSIGKYANEPQLCVPSYNDNIYASKASEKVGWAPGRIPIALFTKATTFVGTPNVKAIVYDEMTIGEIIGLSNDDDTFHAYDGLLVRVKDVHFDQAEGNIPGMYDNYGTPTACTNGNPEEDQNTCVFAPTTLNVGFPQGRIITDASGSRTVVSTSEYAKFARFILPTKDYVGTVTGILGHYTDNGRNDPDQWDWSITLRSRADADLRKDGKSWMDDMIEWKAGWNN